MTTVKLHVMLKYNELFKEVRILLVIIIAVSFLCTIEYNYNNSYIHTKLFSRCELLILQCLVRMSNRDFTNIF